MVQHVRVQQVLLDGRTLLNRLQKMQQNFERRGHFVIMLAQVGRSLLRTKISINVKTNFIEKDNMGRNRTFWKLSKFLCTNDESNWFAAKNTVESNTLFIRFH